MSLNGIALAAKNESFRRRVQAALTLSAVDIMNSDRPLGDPRKGAALTLIQSPSTSHILEPAVWIVAADAAVSALIEEPSGDVLASDSEIQRAASGVWHSLYPDGVT